MTMTQAPAVLRADCGEGPPSSLRRDLAATPRQALRVIFEGEGDYLWEDEALVYVEALDRYRMPLSRYRSLVAEVRPIWMRPAPPDEIVCDGSGEAWEECSETDVGAFPYWRLPWD